MSEHYDVIVVGSGSAGGTVAARLAEDSACNVLLLEAGRDFPDERSGRPPGFFAGASLIGERGAGAGIPGPELDWSYRSEPLPGGRRIELPRGKLVGGSSMVNGTIAVRGRPEDFDRWVQAGASGWSWTEVLPFYERAERELSIKSYPRELWLPVQSLFVAACEELGFRYTDDLNAPDAWDEVVGPWPRNRRNEIRQGTLVTYIRNARDRPNFTLRDRMLVDRVLIEHGRACGVSAIDDNGVRHVARAGQVVLAAGSYGSPAVLLRSGIGPAEDLRALGIECVADLPVGERLMEHPGLRFVVRVDREHARLGWPAMAAVARGHGWWGIPLADDEEEGLVSFGFYLAIVEGNEGSVRIDSTDPTASPAIDHRFAAYLADGSFDDVREDFERLLATSAFTSARARDIHADVSWEECLLRGIGTGTHPAGGCCIGTVVDPDLRVLGVEGLTVADASVFPKHVSNNPNLTCHVVGEIAAEKLARRIGASLEATTHG